MQLKTYQLGLRAAANVTPYAKRISDEEIAFLYMSTPSKIKDAVSDEAWVYAVSQYRMDPNPSKEMPLDQQLLSYVFRQRDGRPAFDWGLKEDLPARMAASDQFHDHPSLQPSNLPELPPSNAGVLSGAFDV